MVCAGDGSLDFILEEAISLGFNPDRNELKIFSDCQAGTDLVTVPNGHTVLGTQWK